VNDSIRQVVTRSIYTSLSTLIPILALLIFGGATLSDFAFALLVGIMAGTYSSIFVASPVLSLYKARRGSRPQREDEPQPGQV
jgi:preprotein translocase subunit SecF